MRNYTISVLALIFSIFLTGCATGPTLKSEPAVARVENTSYFIELTPIGNEIITRGKEVTQTGFVKIPTGTFNKFDGFVLHIKNKSDASIELDWNKTLFVFEDQTDGGFVFRGIIVRDRNAFKLPDIIFPNGELTKTIYPSNHADLSPDGWAVTAMKMGNNGIFITLLVDGKVVTEKLSAKLFEVKKVKKQLK